jgi:hypothetical protein
VGIIHAGIQPVEEIDLPREEKVQWLLDDLCSEVALVHAIEMASIFPPGQSITEGVSILFVERRDVVDEIDPVDRHASGRLERQVGCIKGNVHSLSGTCVHVQKVRSSSALARTVSGWIVDRQLYLSHRSQVHRGHRSPSGTKTFSGCP